MTCNHFAGSQGDVANAVLAAVGYRFRLLSKWLALLRALSLIWPPAQTHHRGRNSTPESCSSHGD